MIPRSIPIYIPSKGRSAYMMTSKAFTAMGLPHYVVVEPDQADDYRAAVSSLGLLCEVLVMDMALKETYDLCDDLGLSISTGSGPARNFCRDHSTAAGAAWHWVVDDNIKAFYRWNRNLKVPVSDGAIFTAMEAFCDRYTNVAMAGPNYFMFASRKHYKPPFHTNSRVYSCNLIRNACPLRWRGRYNEDTILSLDMMKAGWITILFNAFLQEKTVTQSMPGGNTDELYQATPEEKAGAKYSATGTLAKSQMLARVHPDVATVTRRYGRIHHHVDYTPFKARKLILKPGVTIQPGINDYGMELVKLPPKPGTTPR